MMNEAPGDYDHFIIKSISLVINLIKLVELPQVSILTLNQFNLNVQFYKQYKDYKTKMKNILCNMYCVGPINFTMFLTMFGERLQVSSAQYYS